jgi:predicted DNA-binding transcriptional regulator AlpA
MRHFANKKRQKMDNSTQRAFDLMADSLAALGTSFQLLKDGLCGEYQQQPAPSQTNQTDITDVLDMKACSALTGLSISTLYKYCYNRLIPYYKIGKKNCFSKRQVIEWLTSNPVKTAAQIHAEADQYVPKRK